MAKTCGNCGHAALDDHAQFCNRCGAAVPEERKPAFPVCPGCGAVVSDELARFCNRCGSKIPPAPLVCSTCGSPAVDSQSQFCTRCGTTFPLKTARGRICPSCGAPDPTGHSGFCNRCGAPFSGPAIQGENHPAPATVVVTQRKPATTLPPVVVPDSDWEPWNDNAQDPPQIPGHVPPVQPAYRDQQGAVPQKKYSHLPLVADEMRKRSDAEPPRGVADIHNIPSKKKSGSKNKGVMGLLKK